MKWKPYPEYKNSENNLVGPLPLTWKAQRLKRITFLAYGDSLAADDRSHGIYNVMGSNGIVGKHDKCNTKSPCLIVGRKGSFGKVTYSESPCFAIDTTYYIDETQTNNDLRWIYYCLLWLKLDGFSKDSAIPGLAREDAYENIVPYCDLNEQRAIASFLDRETERIDTLIAKKQRQIELLQEKRSALISHAVTKGLDPNVKMKDSGVEWLGEIPEHWNTSRIATICIKITNGYVGPTRDVLKDSGIRYLQSLHIKDGRILFEREPYFVPPEWAAQHAKSTLKIGDVLIVQTGDIGQCAVVPKEYEGANCHALIILSVNKNICLGDYIALVMNSNYGYQTLKTIQTGALHPHLNCEHVRDIIVPIPPIKEQKEIISVAENRRNGIDKLSSAIRFSIEKLNEYRAALISAAVTGKIDVRQEV